MPLFLELSQKKTHVKDYLVQYVHLVYWEVSDLLSLCIRSEFSRDYNICAYLLTPGHALFDSHLEIHRRCCVCRTS